jgi:Secretion system C-terminal sorting domain
MYNMKKFLPLVALFFYATATSAQSGSLLFSENFTSLNNGDLNAANNAGSGWTNSIANYVQIGNTTGLTYSGYTSGTKYATLVQATSSDDPYKNFIGNTSISATNACFYYSFVVRATAALSTGTSNNPPIYLRNAAGNSLSCLYIGSNGSNMRFGISKDETTNPTWSNTNYSFNTTYLVVVRYEFSSVSTTDDKMYVWINPGLASEPTTATALLSLTSGADATSPATNAVNALELQQSSSGAACSVDGIKAAYGTGATTTVNSATAWSNLAPSGGTLPVKVFYFNAAKGDGYNTLNWKAECTSIQATFIIERSVNGMEFFPVKTVVASQARCQQPFDYIDANTSGQGTLYYRIKTIELSENYNYSSILKVTDYQTDMQLVSVSPNPVVNKAQLNITASKKETVNIQIVSMEGKLVYQSILTLQPGTSVINVDVTSLQKGIYTVKGVFGNGEASSIKFVK